MVMSFDRTRDQHQDRSQEVAKGNQPENSSEKGIPSVQESETGAQLGKNTALPLKLAEKLATGFDNDQDRTRFLERIQERLDQGNAQPADIRIRESSPVKDESDMER